MELEFERRMSMYEQIHQVPENFVMQLKGKKQDGTQEPVICVLGGTGSGKNETTGAGCLHERRRYAFNRKKASVQNLLQSRVHR